MSETRLHIPVLMVLMLAMAACGSSKNGTDDEPPYIKEARDRFDEQFSCEPNGTEEYVLCAHRPDTTNLMPIPRVAFFVYDSAANEVVVEQTQITGSVRWIDTYELEMTMIPGIVMQDGGGRPRYRIDVRSGDRRRLGGSDEIPK